MITASFCYARSYAQKGALDRPAPNGIVLRPWMLPYLAKQGMKGIQEPESLRHLSATMLAIAAFFNDD